MRTNQWTKNHNHRAVPANIKKWERAKIEVEIAKIEWHEQSRQDQAVAFFEEDDDTVLVNGRPLHSRAIKFKVVMNTARFDCPVEVGQQWSIRVSKVIPTKLGALLIAEPMSFLGESESLQERRVKEAAKATEAMEVFQKRAQGQLVEISIQLPDSPHNHWEELEIWNRVDHYHGRLVSWQQRDDATIEVTLENASHRQSSTDAEEGHFEGRDRYLEGSKALVLQGAKVECRSWHSSESGERGTSEVLIGTNHGGRDWTLFVY